MPLTPDQQKALTDASGILETEANQLAAYLETTLKSQVNRHGEVCVISDFTPHRVAIAVSNELRRLRDIADHLISIKKASESESCLAHSPQP